MNNPSIYEKYTLFYNKQYIVPCSVSCNTKDRLISMNIKYLIDDPESKAGRTFDLTIQALIVLSLITFMLETLPNLDAQTRRVLEIIEVITVVIFSAEYILRIVAADKKWAYITSFYGLIDLLAILPFYITTGGIDLRGIRVFRLFRLFRIFKLVRYSKAVQHFRLAIKDIKEEIILYLVLTVALLFVASIGIYYFEHEAQPEQFKSVFHCMWWAISTLTTVGYGDIYPITLGGRIFTTLILLLGLGLIAVPSGLVASAFTKVHEDRLHDKTEEKTL